MILPGSETVTVLTADTASSRYGTTDLDWSDPAEVSVPGCLFAPSSSSEDNDNRTAGVRRGSLYMPSGTAITRANRVTIRGEQWEVDGDPSDWRDPFGLGLSGLDVPVRRVEG